MMGLKMINYRQFLKFENELRQIIQKNKTYNESNDSDEIVAFLERMKSVSNEHSTGLWRIFIDYLKKEYRKKFEPERANAILPLDSLTKTFVEALENNNIHKIIRENISIFKEHLEKMNENLQLLQMINLANNDHYKEEAAKIEEMCQSAKQTKADLENDLKQCYDENLRQFIIIRMADIDHILKNISQEHQIFVMDDFTSKLLKKLKNGNCPDSLKDIVEKYHESFADKLLNVLDMNTSVFLEVNRLFKDILTCLLIVKLKRQLGELDDEILNLHDDRVKHIIDEIEKTENEHFSGDIQELLFKAIDVGLDSSLKEFTENRHGMFANSSTYQLSASELTEMNASHDSCVAASSSC